MQHPGSLSLSRALVSGGLALGLAVLGQSVFALPASAATILTVTTTADTGAEDGACGDAQLTTAAEPLSLREAVCLANNLEGAVVITVPAGVYDLTGGELRLGDEPGQDTTITGAGQRSTVIDAGGLSRVLELDFNLTGGISTAISGLTITGGSDDTFGGAGILAGSGNADSADSLTITNSTITDNHAGTGSTSTDLAGGGIQFIGGSMTIADSTVSDNSSGNSPGSGVHYSAQGVAAGEGLSVAGTTFSGNSSAATASGIVNGGALSVTGSGGVVSTVSNSRFVNNTVGGSGAGQARGAAVLAQGGTLTVTGSTFTGNSVSGGSSPAGGAIAVLGGTATAHYNRFKGNVAASGSAIYRGSGTTVNATDNWWGCNTGPGTAGCDSAAGSPTVSPRLVLTASASPASVIGPNATSTITATLTQNSIGSAIAAADLAAFTGLPVSWSDPLPSGATLGSASSAVGSGTASTSYNSAASSGSGHVLATLDNGTATAAVTVNRRPAITSAATAAFRVGTAGSFTVTTTGYPTPTIIKTGALPAGLTFTDNGNGTATLAGTPAVGSGGTYSIGLTASNGLNPNGTQTLTINVNQAPAVTTNPSDQTVNSGASVSFIAAASGSPTPTVQWQRSVGGGSFSNIAGATNPTYTFTAAAGDNGNRYRAVFTNTAGSATSTAATLTVGSAPGISSANTTAFTRGTAGSFTVTTSGSPTPTLTVAGIRPAWLSFTDNGNGTATLAGTPPAGSGGQYSFTINADNGTAPSASQAFTLTVNEPPAITSADHATFQVGTAGSFLVTTSAGFPVATTIAKTGSLPSGVTFTDNGNGTASLAGTPAAGTRGSYPITITATNGASTPATQSFTLTVTDSPVITSADHTTFSVGNPGSFTVTTSPAADSITRTGTLPAGVSFTDHGDGTATLAGTPAAGFGGVYPLTITASDGVTPDTTQNFTLTVNQPAVLTSADHDTFTRGVAGSFTVTTAPGVSAGTTITKTGTLPGGVSFTDNGDGTATIAGTPMVSGTFPITIKASNGVAPDDSQSFTLTVTEVPGITSADHTTFSVGNPGSFTVTTSPAADSITRTGTLPAGVSFTDNGNGTATIAGTPAAGTAGSYPLTISATNATGTRQQSFTLTVVPANASPVITSADHATFAKGSAGSFTVTTTAGYPTATTITKTGTLPAGVSLTDNGDGTATLAGTPTAAGAFIITIRASNGASTDATQTFTLTANAPPVITSANSTTFMSGNAGQSFTVATATGYPTATTLTETGALPAGVSFTDNHNGTATIAGTPAASASTSYPITVKASNGVPPDATQSFTLKVATAPILTVPNSAARSSSWPSGSGSGSWASVV